MGYTSVPERGLLGCLSSCLDSHAIAHLLVSWVTQWGSFLRRGVHIFWVCSLLKAATGREVRLQMLCRRGRTLFSLISSIFLLIIPLYLSTVMWFDDDIPIIESSPETPTTVWGR
ncbi:uncharacterized protein BDW70DRAFT_132097 [Aspergillus foveolatus]|uniref:uncharacterized protein n=1 Tax=Aspergillus foveolatus TaxID=210207 RepID=UPI003CCDBE11